MGNSEVGHMNLGAGRVVRQSLTHIGALIEDGDFFGSPVLGEVYRAGSATAATLHLMGLVSDGGVHSDINHLFALLELAKRRAVPRVRVHAFTDGRDSPPDGGRNYLALVEAKLDELRALGLDAAIATVSGRYYAMDRDRRWQRTQAAYEAIVCSRARYTAVRAAAALEAAYARGETDEFVTPTVIGSAVEPSDADGSSVGAGVAAGDAV